MQSETDKIRKKCSNHDFYLLWLALIVGAGMAILAFSGCGTIEGARSDLHKLTAPTRLADSN